MPLTSSRGWVYSTSDSAAGAALDSFADRILALDQGMEQILESAKAFSAEPSVRLAAAFFWLFGQTPETQREAGAHLEAVRARVDDLTSRELQWLRALELWHSRAFDAAASVFESITELWPEDLLALRAAEFLYYVIGQQFSGERFLAHTSRLAARHGADPDFLAMHAFANELAGNALEARRTAEVGISRRAVNPWAQHALQHVLLWEGSPESASELMEGWLDGWTRVARTVHCHNAWHVALMHLDRLDAARAFRVFDAHVWNQTPGFVVEQLDSIAFLWRAEMAGVEVAGDRWRALVPPIRPVCESLFMPFSTVHYAYALARAGEEDAVESLLRVTRTRAAEDDAEASRVWRPVGLPMVEAAVQLARGQAGAAAGRFEGVMPLMPRIGGSDAQDDLFRFAFLDSLEKSGRRADATAYLRDRLDQKSPSPLEEQILARLG